MEIKAIFLIIAGLFSLTAAISDWDFFINSRKAQVFLKLFGRNGTRVFYGLLGIAVATIGALFQLGIISE